MTGKPSVWVAMRWLSEVNFWELVWTYLGKSGERSIALKLCLAETHDFRGLDLGFYIIVFSTLFNIKPLLKSVHLKRSHWLHSTKYYIL